MSTTATTATSSPLIPPTVPANAHNANSAIIPGTPMHPRRRSSEGGRSCTEHESRAGSGQVGNRRLIDPYRILHAVADCRVDDTDVPHDQRGPRGDPFKLVLGAQRGDLGVASSNQDEAPEVTTVGAEQHRLVALNASAFP